MHLKGIRYKKPEEVISHWNEENVSLGSQFTLYWDWHVQVLAWQYPSAFGCEALSRASPLLDVWADPVPLPIPHRPMFSWNLGEKWTIFKTFWDRNRPPERPTQARAGAGASHLSCFSPGFLPAAEPLHGEDEWGLAHHPREATQLSPCSLKWCQRDWINGVAGEEQQEHTLPSLPEGTGNLS